MRSLWHVDDLSLAGKDVRPQAQIIVLLASLIQQKIFVWTLHGIDLIFVHRARIVRVELLGKMNKSTTIVRILKKYNVLCMQIDRPHVSVLIEEVLHHEDHQDVSVMRFVLEYLSQPLIGFVHHVVEDDKRIGQSVNRIRFRHPVAEKST